jgi:hypothetical protein
MVILFLPTVGELEHSNDGLDIYSFKSTLKGWTFPPGGPLSPLIVMTLQSKAHFLGKDFITETLPHEIAHYLGLPHTFIKDDDWTEAKKRSAGAEYVAIAQVMQKDCGRAQWRTLGQIHDFDYLQSHSTVSDTVPFWLQNDPISRNCRRAYADLIGDPSLDPKLNLMNYNVPAGFHRGETYYDEVKRDTYLTPSQIERAQSRLVEMATLNETFSEPRNMCDTK